MASEKKDPKKNENEITKIETSMIDLDEDSITEEMLNKARVNVGGRPPTYDLTEKDLKGVTNYCLLGCSMYELADFLGITKSTLHKWMLEKPLLSDAINEGKEISNSKVASSLFRRANGYITKETTYELPYDAKAEDYEGEDAKELPVKKIVIKEVPPDVGACKMILANRTKKWSEKSIVDNISSDGSMTPNKNEVEIISSNYKKIIDQKGDIVYVEIKKD